MCGACVCVCLLYFPLCVCVSVAGERQMSQLTDHYLDVQNLSFKSCAQGRKFAEKSMQVNHLPTNREREERQRGRRRGEGDQSDRFVFFVKVAFTPIKGNGTPGESMSLFSIINTSHNNNNNDN